MEVSKRGMVLSTGRELFANRFIIGINDDLELFEGYDGGLDTSLLTEDYEPIPMTMDERRELAEYMISLWTRWVEEGPLIQVQPQKVPTDFVPSTITTGIAERLQTISQQIFSLTRLEQIIQEFNLFAREKKDQTPEEVVNLMRSRIDLKVHRNDAFQLSFIDANPRLAMLVTNKLASLFIEENLKVREQQAIGTSQFLGDGGQQVVRSLGLFRRHGTGDPAEHVQRLKLQLDGAPLVDTHQVAAPGTRLADVADFSPARVRETQPERRTGRRIERSSAPSCYWPN